MFQGFLPNGAGKVGITRVLQPTTKKGAIERAFLEVADMEQILVEDPHFHLAATKDITAISKRLGA